jgi:hypothetical protein
VPNFIRKPVVHVTSGFPVLWRSQRVPMSRDRRLLRSPSGAEGQAAHTVQVMAGGDTDHGVGPFRSIDPVFSNTVTISTAGIRSFPVAEGWTGCRGHCAPALPLDAFGQLSPPKG